MDRMTEVLPNAKSRNLKKFLAYLKWDPGSVIEHVDRDVNEILRDSQTTALVIDVNSFAKYG